MKDINKFCLFFSLLMLLSLSLAVIAQKKDAPAPPADNASLEETQKWTGKAAKIYFEYRKTETRGGVSNGVYFGITDMRFDRCEMSYKVTRKTNSYRDADGRVYLPTTGQKPVKLNLQEYDPDKIDFISGEQPDLKILVLKRHENAVTRPALANGQKDNSKGNSKGNSKDSAKEYFVQEMKADGAEAIKNAFSRMITLCNSAPPEHKTTQN